MKIRFKVLHWILLLAIVLLIFQHDVILRYYALWFGFIELIFTDISAACEIFNLKLADVILSGIFIIVLPILFFLCRNRWKILKSRLNFSDALLLLLIWILLFAPIITSENPEFSKNLSVTKLLSPLSTVKFVNLASKESDPVTEKEKFVRQLNKTIKLPYNERIVFADSIMVSENIIVYQKGNIIELQMKDLQLKDGKPAIYNKFFLLGTDEYGRDNFARLIYGTRISLFVGFGAVAVSFFIGVVLGFLAGYRGGIFDTALNRFAELFLSFPVIYLIVLILALFGSSLFSVIIVLGISGWMTLFKIVRGEVVSLKQKDFFISAELLRLKKSQLLTKEILPVMLGPVVVNLVLLFSNVILAEAALSYLGLGTGNLYPSWGAMINSGQEYIYKAWWMIVFPGAALILTLFTVNSYGRRVSKVINPRLEG